MISCYLLLHLHEGSKQREKTRELERLLSTALALANQPYGSSAIAPGPQSRVTSSQFYTEQASPLVRYYGPLSSSGMTAPTPAVAPPFDFPTSGSFALDSDLTNDDANRAPQTSPSSNLEFDHSRSIMESLSTDDPSTACLSFQDSMQASVHDKDMLSPAVLYSNHGPETASSPEIMKASQILSYLCSDSERKSVGKVIGSEELGLRDIVRHGLVALGSTMEAAQYDSANDKPAELWIKEICSICAPYGIQLTVWTGVRVILQMKARPGSSAHFDQQGANIQQEASGQLPDIYTNKITLKSSSWMSASVANAEFLRIPLELLLVDNSESPFTQQSNSISSPDTRFVNNDASSASTQEQVAVPFRVKEITSDMAPTAVQCTKSHHPYLDLIPWPSFRSKAIIATCVTPPLIDEEDLCLDLMNNAMRCWGSMRSQHGRGEGAPWDMRSWEAAPWFIEKWATLIDGDGGEIARNSAWWRNQMGMPSFN